MVLDVEPMYCAEQINIPENLGEVLKAYAKEVIRQQPADIFEFSAQYFAQLDQQEDEFMDNAQWQVERDHVFKLVYECSNLKSEEIELIKLREICEGETVGIPSKAVDMTLELILAEEEGKVQWRKYVIAMCAQVSGVEDVTGFVRLLMDPAMFGNDVGQLAKEEFVTLFDWWSSIDQAISAELKEGLFNSLSSGPDMVSYEAFLDALGKAEAETASAPA
uniref:RIIa domain-containing protein n=1 Tax=Hemiselmis tepida TaxID=464990 RepID=A0A7S0VPC3_9CRYP